MNKILVFFLLSKYIIYVCIYLFIYLFICVCVFNHDERMIWGLPATGIFPASKDNVCAFIFIYNCD